MNAETRIYLTRFQPRSYQLDLIHAIEKRNFKRSVCVWPRRAGKDICALQIAIRACIRSVCSIFYLFPTFAHARRVIWDAITNEGFRMLDYIPPELIESKNSTMLQIRFTNGSLLQFAGTDNFDALRGINFHGAVFSEYAWQDPRAYQVLRPILAVNNGWALFISTPSGKNHLYELHEIAKANPELYYLSYLTLDDTKHMSDEQFEQERLEMSEDLIQQEYFCSFDLGVEGAYYAKYLNKMRLNYQIGSVPWEPNHKVHTAWDLGVRDACSIIFFQTIGSTIRIIDYYEKSKEGLEHYAKVVHSKPYQYGRHIAPHDIKVTEFGSGITRLEKARQLDIKFTIAENISIMDGIEAVRSTLNKVWIDEGRCGPLLKSLENYRQEFDAKKNVYLPRPRHDFASHAADAMRYLCISLPKMRDGITADELEKRYRETVYGDVKMPYMFRDEKEF